MPPKIAYFINQYPKVSHSFIRREILALERQGFEILRIALRGWDGELVDEEDRQERARTRYVLQEGLSALAWPLIRTLLTRPGRFMSALALAIRMGRHADRPLPYHFVYLVEACRILPWLQSFGATHVHAHFGTNSAEVVMLAHVLGGPSYSFTVHGMDEFDSAKFLGFGEKVHRAAFVVAVCSYGRGQLYRWVDHAHWRKVKVVHCGLEPAFHAVAPVQPPAAPRLVCVGRLSKEKAQLLLVEAAARLAAKGVRLELVLAGDGEMRSEIEALIATHALTKQIRITGWINSDQVREEILAARGLVLPSFIEGLPVVIMEAMALRRPVLTTYVGGIPELVRPGENGWLFPAGDVDELAAALEDFLSRPAEELRVMGEAGHARVLERHSIDVEAAKLAGFFRETASGALTNV
jgi:colanic acid/amylovoran biosynthesis glycosyltransferase